MKNSFKISLFVLLLTATITSCEPGTKNTSETPAPVDTNVVDSSKIDTNVVDSTKIKADSVPQAK
jgi:hypothetical protein